MVKDDKIILEWDEAAEPWANFLREGKDYSRVEFLNPATFKIIGNISGKQVLDLACGEGYNTRILAERGAVVVGVDFSEKMIELAKQREMEDGFGVKYYVSDAANLKDIPSSQFDLVTCFLSLQTIERYKEAISEVARVLKRGGRFIFSIPHPCFEQIVKSGQPISGWRYEEGTIGTEREKALQLEIKNYFGTMRYQVPMTSERFTKAFKVTLFHRTLTDYFQALNMSGLLVSRLLEPKPTLETASKYPALRKALKIPQFIIIEITKLKEK